jgi:ATP-dependent Clp protease protease subunit
VSKKSDTNNQFFSSNYNPDKRCVYFLGKDIDEESASEFIKNLIELDSASKETITIYLNSGGGDLIQALAMYDAMKLCKSRIKVFVIGQASSAASLILQAAHVRIMSENSHIMIHIGQESYEENHPRNLERWLEYSKVLENKMINIYLSNIRRIKKRYTKHQLISLLQFDTILTPNKALELGLVDMVESNWR